jgi:hypothetical protein
VSQNDAALPLFSVEPVDTTATVGDASAVFYCTAENKDIFVLKWELESASANPLTHNDVVFSPRIGKYNVSGDHSNGEYNLVILDIEQSDEGVYTCGLEESGKKNTHAATLHVQGNMH